MKITKQKIKDNKVIISNFGYLSLLHLISLLLPLISFPYLIKVLGTEYYGKTVLALATVSYFSILINFGFNISATKDIAIYRDNKAKLSEIFSAVFSIKLIIFSLCFFILLLLINSIPSFKNEKLLYLFSFGVCFNELLFQQFFFQGIEKMKYITIINLSSRILFFALIFIVIKEKSDYLFVPILTSSGALIGGIIAHFIITTKEKVYFKIQSIKKLKETFNSSLPFFLSRISSVVVNKTNTILIGNFIGYNEVAFYDFAQKILTVCLIPFDLINQVVYPHVARTKNMKFVKKIIVYAFSLAVIIYISIVLLRKFIINIISTDMLPASPLIIILSLNIIILSISFFLGNTVLVVNNHNKEFNKSIIYSGVIYVLINLILVTIGLIDVYIFAFVSVFIELFCLTYRYYYTKKYNLFHS